MFQEFPKWIGVDELGRDIIVFSADEEAARRPSKPVQSQVTEQSPVAPTVSDSAPKKRGRPRRAEAQ